MGTRWGGKKKKMKERITSPPSPSFFFFTLNMLWSTSCAFSVSCETFLFEFCVQLHFFFFFSPVCGFVVFDYISIIRSAFVSRGCVLQTDAVIDGWGNCCRNEHLFLQHFKRQRVVLLAPSEMRLAGCRAQVVSCAEQLSEFQRWACKKKKKNDFWRFYGLNRIRMHSDRKLIRVKEVYNTYLA